MTPPPPFDYADAFSRNIGWMTEAEQTALRGKSVAIAGMGGVGGSHLLTLARLGVGRFRLADFDTFEIANLNRQAGASVPAIGRPKLDVMAEMALGINPTLEIARFPDGIGPDSLDQFLSGADLFIDGIDFFALPVRRLAFQRCAELRIPALTAAPLGFGAGYLAFLPGSMTFEDYFRLDGCSETEQYLRFLVGLAPRGLHASYLVDPSRIDLAAKRGPSTGVACQLCSGVIGAMATRLLLARGGVKAAPYHHHFDPYLGRFAVTRLPRGNAGAAQRLRLAAARRKLCRSGDAPTEPKALAAILARLVDAARRARRRGPRP